MGWDGMFPFSPARRVISLPPLLNISTSASSICKIDHHNPFDLTGSPVLSILRREKMFTLMSLDRQREMGSCFTWPYVEPVRIPSQLN